MGVKNIMDKTSYGGKKNIKQKQKQKLRRRIQYTRNKLYLSSFNMNKITKLQNYKIAKLVSSTTNVGGHWVKNKMK